MPAADVRSQVARAHLEFCAALHGGLACGTRESVCWSPYSVAATLTMAALGAGGQTRDELRTLLSGSTGVDPAEHVEFFRDATRLTPASNVETPELAVFNAMYTQRGLPILPEFGAALADLHGDVREAPFEQPEQARKLINSAVADATSGLLDELVRPGAIDTDTVATLVNALYLKAAWATPFEQDATTDAPFHAPGGTRQVPMMRVTGAFGFARLAGWQVVSLPAAGGAQAEVLLPDDPATLDSTVDVDTLAELVDAPRSARVALALPRLKVRFSAVLARLLAAAGAPRMFSDDAEFTGISPAPLSVTDVLHESLLRLDENGMEGAAATAMAFQLTAAVQEPEPVEVTVDRPFLLLVHHRETGAVYFLATVREP